MDCKNLLLKEWYPDGFTRVPLAVGEVFDPGAATSGLMQADLIEPADDYGAEPVKQSPKVKQPDRETVEATIAEAVEAAETFEETPAAVVAETSAASVAPAPVIQAPGRKKKNR